MSISLVPLIYGQVAKLTALARLTKIISFDKTRLLLKSPVESQFAYCPLTWMYL